MSNSLNIGKNKKKDRRIAILKAAKLELKNEGYSGMSIRKIAESAQISLGLMYSYFSNKEELFATIYVEHLGEFKEQAIVLSKQATSFEELAINLLKIYLPVYKTFGNEFNLFSTLMDPNSFPENIRNELSNIAIELMSLIYKETQRLAKEEGMDLNSLPNSEYILSGLWIIFNGLANHYAGERQNLYGHDIEKMTHFLVQTFWRGLKDTSYIGKK